jgi:hypothetical protein
MMNVEKLLLVVLVFGLLDFVATQSAQLLASMQLTALKTVLSALGELSQ